MKPSISSITLINPKPEQSTLHLGLPLGLASLAAYLMERGIETKIYDMCVGNKVKMDSDWYGITAVSSARSVVEKIARRLDGKVVMGGVDPTVMPDYYLNFTDYVIRGEGEIALFELLSGADPSTIPNLSYKTGKIKHHNPIGELLERLPFPAYDLLNTKEYIKRSESRYGFRWIPVMLSRGCPFNCYFCSTRTIWGQTCRVMRVKRAADLIESLLENYDVDGFLIYDSIFGANIKWGNAFCKEIIKRGLKFEWFCYKRVDTITVKALALMKKAGCVTICYGLESGSQELLDKFNKKQTVEQGRKAVALTAGMGIVPILTFVIGTPYETEKTLRMTEALWYELLEEYDCIIQPSIYRPSPGSHFYDMLGEQTGDRQISIEAIEGVVHKQEEKYGASEAKEILRWI